MYPLARVMTLPLLVYRETMETSSLCFVWSANPAATPGGDPEASGPEAVIPEGCGGPKRADVKRAHKPPLLQVAHRHAGYISTVLPADRIGGSSRPMSMCSQHMST